MEKPLFSRWTWFLGFVLLALSVAGTGLVMNSHASDEPTQNVKAVADSLDWSDGAVCIGHVDIEYGIRNLSPLQPGRVQAVLVHEDDTVKAGTPLLRLDDKPARFLLSQTQAELEAAQANLEDARRLPQQHEHQIAQQEQAIEADKHKVEAAKQTVVLRQKQVKVSGFGPHPEVRIADELVKELEAAQQADEDKLKELQLLDTRTSIIRAEQDVRAKQARLASAQYAVEETALRAPCDGKVLRILVGPGEMLGSQPNQPAVQFAPLGPRIIRAEVEQEYASRVTLGQTAMIQDDSRAGPIWHGKVVRISDWYTHRRSVLQEPLQVNDVRTLECIIQLQPSPTTPRIGQRVRVNLGQAAAIKG